MIGPGGCHLEMGVRRPDLEQSLAVLNESDICSCTRSQVRDRRAPIALSDHVTSTIRPPDFRSKQTMAFRQRACAVAGVRPIARWQNSQVGRGWTSTTETGQSNAILGASRRKAP